MGLSPPQSHLPHPALPPGPQMLLSHPPARVTPPPQSHPHLSEAMSSLQAWPPGPTGAAGGGCVSRRGHTHPTPPPRSGPRGTVSGQGCPMCAVLEAAGQGDGLCPVPRTWRRRLPPRAGPTAGQALGQGLWEGGNGPFQSEGGRGGGGPRVLAHARPSWVHMLGLRSWSHWGTCCPRAGRSRRRALS